MKKLAMIIGLLVVCISVPAMAMEVRFEIKEGAEAVCEIALNAMYAENTDVTAYIERMKKDPKVRQVVQEDAPDPEAWWRWFDAMPVETEMYINQKAVMEWLEGYAAVPKEQRGRFSYNLLLLDVAESMENGAH